VRQLNLVGLVCLSVFVLTAVMSSSASALLLPEILPQAAERTWTGEADGTNTLFEFSGGQKFECKETTVTGTEEAKKPLGLYHMAFKNCGGVSCTTAGDAAGTILLLGTWHLVFDQEKPELLTGTLFLVELTKMECSLLGKVEIKGSILCLDLPLLTDQRHFLFHCTQDKGVADEKKYFNAGDKAGSEGKVQLLASKNGGTFEEWAELALGLVLYKEGLSIDA
jgi:hypothetical protein